MWKRTKSNLDQEKLYSVPQLRDRGWTDAAIRKFLPAEPDDTRPNPRYSNAGAPMKFWTKVRVHRTEKSKRFQEWRVGSKARKVSANAGVTTRMLNMVERVEQADITIERGWSDDQIRDLAVRTHGGNYAGDPGPFQWSNRTARNCIRHCLTNYEELWSLINRGETGEWAYDALRNRVDDLIDETYPQFRGD